MIEIMAVRGYWIDDEPFLSFGDACKHARLLSEFFCSAVNVLRDPLIRDGEEIEGEQTVARFVNGKKTFPIGS